MAPTRYDAVAMTLHWVIAFAILGTFAGGLVMTNLAAGDPYRFTIYQLHKSFGLTILVLSLARLGWRLTHVAPALPEGTPAWQGVLARATHVLFYALIVIVPLSGWALVSSATRAVPTFWFGLFEVPHLPGLQGFADQRAVFTQVRDAHEILALAMIGLLVLHVAAALKHHYIDRDDVLARMLPRFGGR